MVSLILGNLEELSAAKQTLLALKGEDTWV